MKNRLLCLSIIALVLVIGINIPGTHAAENNDRINLDQIPLEEMLPIKNIHGVNLDQADRIFDHFLEKRGTPKAVKGFGDTDRATLSVYLFRYPNQEAAENHLSVSVYEDSDRKKRIIREIKGRSVEIEFFKTQSKYDDGRVHSTRA